MKIGDINIKKPLLLAPMAGVTDLPYRMICKEMGADIVYTEFVSSNGIIRENKKTLDMIKFSDYERPLGVQIFGEEAEVVAASAKLIEERFAPDIIDINYGCPVPKITKKGAGSAALKDLSLMKKITSAVVKSASNTPITVKMRAGWCETSKVFIEAGKILEDIGVQAITLHPRTTKQKFKGQADWSLIAELKDNISIPVIGNGDVKTVDDYNNIINETGCDGVMIGRAALGNPWIFKQIKEVNSNTKEFSEVSRKDILIACIRHYNLLRDNKNEGQCLNLTKKHFSWYLKGFNNASAWRKKILLSQNLTEVDSIIDEMNEKLS